MVESEPVKLGEQVKQGTEPKSRSPIDIELLTDLMLLADGGNPRAQSLLQDIFKIDSIQEKSNFPTAINQQKQTYLLMCANTFGPIFGKPFLDMALYDARTWRGYKGFNYLGNVEAVKQGTDLSGLLLQPQQQGQPEQKKRGFFQRARDEWKPQGEQLQD